MLVISYVMPHFIRWSNTGTETAMYDTSLKNTWEIEKNSTVFKNYDPGRNNSFYAEGF